MNNLITSHISILLLYPAIASYHSNASMINFTIKVESSLGFKHLKHLVSILFPGLIFFNVCLARFRDTRVFFGVVN